MSNRTLLLADDSVTIRKVVDLTFADEGIDVVAVADGDAAIRSIDSSRPDVVLADVHMPGLNGYQVCERIKQNEATRDLPVVLLVGSFEPFDEQEAARVGADAHLTKPFQSIRMLVDKVDELIKRSGPADDEVDTAELEADAVPAAADMPGQVRTADTSDIDNLYSASFAETAEIPNADTQPIEYVDAGMDDEMIEETYASANENAIAANGTIESAAANETGKAVNDEPGVDIAALETAPLNAPIEAWQRSPFTSYAEPASDSQYDPFQELGGPVVDGAKTIEDIDLLEIPPASAPELEITAPAQAADTGSGPPVVSISPELIEIIVQKVVERLSERE